MAKRAGPKPVYASFKVTTPKLEAYFPNISEPDEMSGKYQVGVVVDESPECQQMVDRLIEFQNEELEKMGEDPQDTLICLKDEKEKDEKTGKWTHKTGRQLLFFKSGERSYFDVVGPDKKRIEDDVIRKGDTIRVNGQPFFGVMKGDPYVSFYLNAVQLVESRGASGVDAFDDETGGGQTEDESPFDNEDAVKDLV